MKQPIIKAPRKKSARQEQDEHILFAKYLKLQYPKLLFSSDLSGAFLSKTEAGIAKAARANDFAVPDIAIYMPMTHIPNFAAHGLYIELKKSGQTLRQIKNPERWKDEHIERQAYSLARLNGCGYAAFFAVGFDAARAVVDAYMDTGKANKMTQMLSNSHLTTNVIYRPLIAADKFPIFGIK